MRKGGTCERGLAWARSDFSADKFLEYSDIPACESRPSRRQSDDARRGAGPTMQQQRKTAFGSGKEQQWALVES